MSRPETPTWTPTAPTEPGHYWLRPNSERPAKVYEVCREPETGLLCIKLNHAGWQSVESLKGEWQGPLTPNESPAGASAGDAELAAKLQEWADDAGAEAATRYQYDRVGHDVLLEGRNLARTAAARLSPTPPVTAAGTDFSKWKRENLERLAAELTEKVVRCPHCSGGAAPPSPPSRDRETAERRGREWAAQVCDGERKRCDDRADQLVLEGCRDDAHKYRCRAAAAETLADFIRRGPR